MYKSLIIVILINPIYSIAQNNTDSIDKVTQRDSTYKTSGKVESNSVRKNIIKINLSSLLVNTYSISFERMIGRKKSIQIGYGYHPYSYLLENPLGKILTNHEAYLDFAYYNFQTNRISIYK